MIPQMSRDGLDPPTESAPQCRGLRDYVTATRPPTAGYQLVDSSSGTEAPTPRLLRSALHYRSFSLGWGPTWPATSPARRLSKPNPLKAPYDRHFCQIDRAPACLSTPPPRRAQPQPPHRVRWYVPWYAFSTSPPTLSG